MNIKNNYNFICKLSNIFHLQDVCNNIIKNPNTDLYVKIGLKCACAAGNMEIAKWILSIRPSLNISFDNNYVLKCACSKGHLRILKWLLEMKTRIYKSIWHELLAISCIYNKLNTAQWIYKIAQYEINISFEEESLFRYTCKYNAIETAKWLLKIKPNINISAVNEDAFACACLQGYLHIAQWLLKIKPDINISINNENAFICACREGHLKILQWLIKIKPDINISEQAFLTACEYKHIKTAQWLLKIKPTLDICINNKNAFILACKGGHKHLVEWLLKIQPNINIDILNEGFQIVCKNKKYELAKLLLKIKPKIDISINNDLIFKIICIKRSLEFAKWYSTLNPYKYIIDTNSVYKHKNHKIYQENLDVYGINLINKRYFCYSIDINYVFYQILTYLIKANYINYFNAVLITNLTLKF